MLRTGLRSGDGEGKAIPIAGRLARVERGILGRWYRRGVVAGRKPGARPGRSRVTWKMGCLFLMNQPRSPRSRSSRWSCARFPKRMSQWARVCGIGSRMWRERLNCLPPDASSRVVDGLQVAAAGGGWGEVEADPALKGWATVGRRYATNGYRGRSVTGTDSLLARVAPGIGTAPPSGSEAEPSPTARR
jgi:hypothetical protein